MDNYLYVRNPNRESILSSRCRVAGTFLTRLRGLLFGPALGEGEGLLLRPCGSVHTYGMTYSIDIIYLDRIGKVVALRENVQPNRALLGAPGAWQILELPPGTIAATGTQAGDRLQTGPPEPPRNTLGCAPLRQWT